MFSNRDISAFRVGLAGLLATCLLPACSNGPIIEGTNKTSAGVAERSPRVGIAVTPGITARNPVPPAALVRPAPLPVPVPAVDVVAQLLDYSERVRLMPLTEIGQEATRLGEAVAPQAQLRLALVLSQLRQLPELIRAQELLARVLANTAPEAQTLHPLARLLAARYAEQRRLEEQLEKQSQQMREIQRRSDQTLERLEALKAIERSMTSRLPASAAPAPATILPNSPTRRGRTPAH